MKQIRYTTPHGDIIFPAEVDSVTSHLASSDWTTWDCSGNAEACLDVASTTKLDEDLKFEETLDAFGTFFVYRTDPCIVIKQPDPGLFFLTWFEDGDELVPYNGGDIHQFLLSHCGGNPFQCPLPCLTELPATISIVRQFVDTLSRSTVVDWVSWFNLDIPEDWYT